MTFWDVIGKSKTAAKIKKKNKKKKRIRMWVLKQYQESGSYCWQVDMCISTLRKCVLFMQDYEDFSGHF